jgi:hypothetical protein
MKKKVVIILTRIEASEAFERNSTLKIAVGFRIGNW